jgi:hypothetical protein
VAKIIEAKSGKIRRILIFCQEISRVLIEVVPSLIAGPTKTLKKTKKKGGSRRNRPRRAAR